jgi:UDP-N-acetylmuramoylalanine-D-glutamate ligase
LHEIFEILCDEEDRHDLLFSPGNPSGNDYANYIERGDHFNKLKAEYLD